MRVVRRLFNLLHGASVVLAMAAYVVMAVVVIISVILRYVFDFGFPLAEEAPTVLMVWFTFLAMAIGVKQNLHININVLPQRLPAWFVAALDKLKHLVILVIGLAMIWYGLILVGFTSKSILPASHLPASTLYLVLPISAVLIIYDAVLDLLGIQKKDKGIEEGFLGGSTDA